MLPTDKYHCDFTQVGQDHEIPVGQFPANSAIITATELKQGGNFQTEGIKCSDELFFDPYLGAVQVLSTDVDIFPAWSSSDDFEVAIPGTGERQALARESGSVGPSIESG